MATVQLSARLSEIFSARSIAGYYETLKQDVRPYLGEALFPNKKTMGLELKYVKGRAGSPVLLRGASFDAAAPIRPRIPFKQLTNEMPFFRESMVIGEMDRQELMKAMLAGDAYANSIIENIYDDEYHLVLGADAALERMRMMLLSTGYIHGSADEVPLDYDFGFEEDKQFMLLTGDATWNNSQTAKPLEVLERCMRVAKLGTARAICTRNTYLQMIACDSIKNSMFVLPMSPAYVPPAQIEAYITAALGITFIVLDDEANTFRERVDGQDLTMFPDGIMTLIPSTGTLGFTHKGTTPEEADLLGGSEADVQIVNDGVAITSKLEYGPPINMKTTVSQIGMPSCERIDRMHIIQTSTPPA